ncbi:hypothetical protein [Oharaeibacter diazotrophicus]|uniref:Uncharacterized protein n=1 Tax=Oharaeibacter diazotrophicus TaxID=1920512 RepID=A0A4R6RCU7_9HYPH|nr:hypothetical protein [Oharaeibacter diazotrophicus]TDP83904.1 hypothetical protein EDD54_2501 [Oharaeibacter diazotrophicus]BBE72946.1 hypothetical protein OHA_1_02550 [Pleomorphomonas sp. SM30]GLS74725.1 hypothetical protein GCM10007904_00600 [Oharaeibacter diazotrophicus]
MNVDGLLRNLKVLVRAERILADIRLRRAATRAGLVVTAGLFAVIGLTLLGYAGFLALETVIGPIWAAVALGAAALAFAAVLMLVAGSSEPGRDHAVALDLEAAALDALAADLRGAEADIRGLAGFVRNPFDSALPGLIVPLATVLLKALRGKRGKDAPPA